MENKILYGPDEVRLTSENNSGLKPQKMKLVRVNNMKTLSSKFSFEADESGFDSSIFENPQFNVRYYFNDMSVQDIDDLINGRAYLEFWLPIVDHKKPSGNGAMYSETDIINGMEGYFYNTMQTGGVPGELNHPGLFVYSDNKESVMNFTNNMQRIKTIDQGNVVWYVVAYKLENNISYFKFRTSVNNRRVVMDMLNGKAPSGSLRVTGKFKIDPNTGLKVGENIKMVTIDYVENPGFKMATLYKGAVSLISSGLNKMKRVVFTNDQNKSNNYAFESLDNKDVAKELEGFDVYVNPENSVYLVGVKHEETTRVNKSTKRKDLDSLIDEMSFL